MITGLCWLALEVKHLDRAAGFYREHLGLSTARETDREIAFRVGKSDLVFRRPAGVPRGGLHTHYALSARVGTYDAWHDRLSASFDLHEHAFGDSRSLYFYDTEGNCVEIGESRTTDGSSAADGSNPADEPDVEEATGSVSSLTGIFEIVLEVTDIDRAEAFYTDLGFEVIDRGTDRKRTRLTAGPFDLELWEPHLGIADARGGVHVDLGIAVEEPKTLVAAVEARARSVATLGEVGETGERDGIGERDRTDDPEGADGRATGYRVHDPDGHVLTLRTV